NSLKGVLRNSMSPMAARRNGLLNWISPLHLAMQTEIGRQLRLEYEAPKTLPPLLTACVARLDKPLEASRHPCGREELHLGGTLAQEPLSVAKALIQSASYPPSASSIDPDFRRDKRLKASRLL